MMSAWPKTLDRDLLEEPFEHRRLVALAWCEHEGQRLAASLGSEVDPSLRSGQALGARAALASPESFRHPGRCPWLQRRVGALERSSHRRSGLPSRSYLRHQPAVGEPRALAARCQPSATCRRVSRRSTRCRSTRAALARVLQFSRSRVGREKRSDGSGSAARSAASAVAAEAQASPTACQSSRVCSPPESTLRVSIHALAARWG